MNQMSWGDVAEIISAIAAILVAIVGLVKLRRKPDKED